MSRTIGWLSLLVIAVVGLATAAQAPPNPNPKLLRQYAKLQEQAARRHGASQAEALAQMAEIDFEMAHDSYRADQPDGGEQRLDLAIQHADRACALLRVEAAQGRIKGMKNVEISLQNIAYGLQNLAPQLRFRQRPTVQAAAGHFADLRAQVLQWIFAPKPKTEGLLGVRARIALPAQSLNFDPLTPVETEQVRATAGHLDKRVPLLVQFAEARLTEFERIRTASPRPPERDTRMYELLREYKAILPELDDAVDDLAQGVVTSETGGQTVNVVHTLDPTVAALQRFATTLHHIQTASTPADLATYRFALDDCVDVTSDSLQNAQEDRAEAEKGKKKPAPDSRALRGNA